MGAHGVPILKWYGMVWHVFTRKYTQYTVGSTFCYVVVVGVGVVVVATFNQTWQYFS
jgi:hypothetical protein